MTREIKFRAWNKKSKRLVTPNWEWCIDPNGVPCGTGEGGGLIGIPEYEVMQYTGLKDKNGKKIYEGDIVHETWWKLGDEKLGMAEGIIKEVMWNIRTAYAEGECMHTSTGFMFEPFVEGHFVEVIGNIYENPELIKP